jgi:hypothetical protein
MMMINECRAVSGMIIAGRNRSSRNTPAPVPIFPPLIPHNENVFLHSRTVSYIGSASEILCSVTEAEKHCHNITVV